MVSNDKKGDVLDWLSRRLNLTEIFSLLTSYGLFHAELDSSKPLRQALAEAADKPAPSYARWPRVLGLMVMVLIGLEILTGSLLALYYLPTPETAHASLGTLLIMRQAPKGARDKYARALRSSGRFHLAQSSRDGRSL